MPVLVVSRLLFGEWLSDGGTDGVTELDGVTIKIAGTGERFAARGWEIDENGWAIVRVGVNGTRFSISLSEPVERFALGLGDMDVSHIERLHSFSVLPIGAPGLVFDGNEVRSDAKDAVGLVFWDNLAGELSFDVQVNRGKIHFEYIQIERLHDAE